MSLRWPGLAAWWAQRAPRERALLLAMAALGGAYLLVAAVWQPLSAARAAAQDDIRRLDLALAQLEAAPADAAPATAATEAARPVPAVLTETAPEFGLEIRRIEPEGSGARLVIEDAGFADLMVWIEALGQDHGLRVAAIEIDRRPEPGTVSARLTIDR